MSKTREALNLVRMHIIGEALPNKEQALKAIDDALAEPGQEPVRWLVDDAVWERKPTTDDMQMWKDCGMKIMPIIRPLYTSPQPREWQELSDKEIISAISIDQSYNWPYKADENTPSRIAKRIYTALRAKNGG